ncbi:MAG: hypothetical protein JJV97_04595 [SAR324 cluster bacterium]|nr:hypothetical protein [SAR324 cluster bacterium]
MIKLSPLTAIKIVGKILIVWAICWINIGVLWAQNSTYEWIPEYYATIDGEEKLVFTWEFPNSKVVVGNLIGNDLPDLLVGNQAGTLSLYENIGTQAKAKFILRNIRLSGYGVIDNKNDVFREIELNIINKKEKDENKIYAKRPFDFGNRAAPALVNFQGKAKLDLLVGNEDGNLVLIHNIGTIEKPKFEYLIDNQNLFSDLAIREMKLENSVPTFCELNNDDNPDLLIGNADGRVLVFLGDRNNQKHLIFKSSPDFVLKLGYGKNAAPSCVDWEDNMQPAIIVGQRDGYLSYFKNIGTPWMPKFSDPEFFFYKIDAGGEAAPHFTKLSPNSQDLLLGSFSSKIKRYEFRNFEDAKNIWSIDDNITRFERLNSFSKGTNITSGNLLGRGKADILLGSDQGNITFYSNDSAGKGVALTKITDNLLPDHNLPGAAPEIINFDKDKLPTLLVASHGGRIYYFDNAGDANNPDFKVVDDNLIELGNVQSPIARAIDISGKGIFDLIIGGVGTSIKFFKNIGTAEEPKFGDISLDMIVDNTSEGTFSAPSLFNWNNLQVPNLVVGNQSGQLDVLYFNPAKVDLLADVPADFQEFLAQPFEFPHWTYLEEMPEVRPYFIDITDNGLKDMLVSNDKGDILLFLQKKINDLDTDDLFVQYQKARYKKKLQAIREKLGNYKPRNIPPVFIFTPENLIEQTNRKNPVPYLGNLRNKRISDLVIGYQDGKIDIWINTGTRKFWDFKLESTITLPNNEKKAAPLLVDIDGNDTLDLVVGTQSGRLYYYENIGQKPSFEFKLRENYFGDIKVGVNAIPGRLYTRYQTLPDIVIGDVNGVLSIVKNLGFYQDAEFIPQFELETQEQVVLKSELSVAPRFEDLDNDGVPEMIIGNDRGNVQIYDYSYSDEQGYYWKIIPSWSIDKKLGFNTVPTFGDLYGTGVKDMLVALEDGKLLIFRNDAVTPDLLKRLEVDELTKN